MPQLPKWSLALWVSGLLVTILILTPTSAAWIQGIDDQVFDVVSGNETQWLVAVAEFFDVIGGTVAMTTLAVSMGVVIWMIRPQVFSYWALLMVGTTVFNIASKALVDRDRPPDSLVETSAGSFPSGHAMLATAFGLGLALLLPLRSRRSALFLALSFSALMAWSRVYLSAHWLSDVVGGALFGAASATTVAALYRADQSRGS